MLLSPACSLAWASDRAGLAPAQLMWAELGPTPKNKKK